MERKETPKTACIVSTGDELLLGTIVDTNAAFVAARLREHGVSLLRIISVGDDVGNIAAALTEACLLADLVVVSGGLGSTTDDVTAQAAAQAFDVPLIRSAAAERMVLNAFSRFSRTVPECNLKQALLPEGAEVVPNEVGTAPGFALATRRGRAVFLPGVPVELQAMWNFVAQEYLPGGKERPRVVLSCFGMGESAIQEKLAPLTAQFPKIRVSYRAVFPETFVGFGGDDAAAVNDVAKKAQSIIGEPVFDEHGRSLPQAVGERLRDLKLSCGVAESCTGGLVAGLLTREPGASAFFRGGIVAYSNDVKMSLLGVSKDDLKAVGAVSEQVARSMALGARQALGADVAVSTTGIAGPDGATKDKPLGLVHFAIAFPDRTAHYSHVFNGYERPRVQRAAAFKALGFLLAAIRETT
jgi:nicotinamide-nucleotide amidase